MAANDSNKAVRVVAPPNKVVTVDVEAYDLAHVYLSQAEALLDVCGEVAHAEYVDNLKKHSLHTSMLVAGEWIADARKLLLAPGSETTEVEVRHG